MGAIISNRCVVLVAPHQYGWWRNLVDSRVGGSIGFLADFEFYMVVLGVPSGPIAFAAPLGFKILDSQPDSSSMGPVPTDFHVLGDFQKRSHGFFAWYLSCFRPGCFQIHSFEVFGPNHKEPRRKVTQIRGGITARSALFDLFVPIWDFQFSVIFERPSTFPVPIPGV